jgi:hypothetical protein
MKQLEAFEMKQKKYDGKIDQYKRTPLDDLEQFQ